MSAQHFLKSSVFISPMMRLIYRLAGRSADHSLWSPSAAVATYAASLPEAEADRFRSRPPAVAGVWPDATVGAAGVDESKCRPLHYYVARLPAFPDGAHAVSRHAGDCQADNMSPFLGASLDGDAALVTSIDVSTFLLPSISRARAIIGVAEIRFGISLGRADARHALIDSMLIADDAESAMRLRHWL